MLERYLIWFDDKAVALKFHCINRMLHVGGFAKDREMVRKVAGLFTGKTLPRERFTQRNKIRYVFSCTMETLMAGISGAEHTGGVVEKVKSLKRIMS